MGPNKTIKPINNKKEGKPFSPPSLIEVLEYFKEKGYKEEVGKKAYKYYQAGEWKDSRGNQVKNWKQKMVSVWMTDENKISTSVSTFSRAEQGNKKKIEEKQKLKLANNEN